MSPERPEKSLYENAEGLDVPIVFVNASSLEMKLEALLTPGAMVEMDPDDAELMGAFEETALSEQDALESMIDQDWEVA